MSINNPDQIDAVAIRDGFTVLTIFQLDPWPAEATAVGLLSEKIEHYLERASSSAHLAVHASRPHLIELVCIESPPRAVSDLCRTTGVSIRCREPQTDA